MTDTTITWDSLQEPTPPCNPHPKAPHGFARNRSHCLGRYVCDCEGWDAWDDGYQKGFQAGLAAESQSEQDKPNIPD